MLCGHCTTHKATKHLQYSSLDDHLTKPETSWKTLWIFTETWIHDPDKASRLPSTPREPAQAARITS